MTDTPLHRLETEARNLVAQILNGLDCRKYHPTYGYTKTGLRDQVARLEGRLDAIYWLTGGEAFAPSPTDHDKILHGWGKPTLAELRDRITKS